LTESFAAVLRRVPELGYFLAKIWHDPGQNHAGSGERAGPTEGAWEALDRMPASALRRVRTRSRSGGIVSISSSGSRKLPTRGRTL
jgi:hypothetical protein